MIPIHNIPTQNWVITPAALAVGQALPQSALQQNWILHLSGVSITDFQGLAHTNWRLETLLINPDLRRPLNHAVDAFSLPRPPGTEGSHYFVLFRVFQWTLFAALSSIYDQHHAVDAGFAVDAWRANPFLTATDAFSNQLQLDRIFSGMQVDVAVRDSDAFLYRVSYNITLLGQIVFSKGTNVK